MTAVAFAVGVKLLPMYLLVIVGLIAGRTLHIGAETVGKLLVYVLAPGVVFFSVLAMDITPARLTLPLLYGCVCSLIGTTAYAVIGKLPERDARGVLGFAIGSGNTGFFGLPMAVALLGADYVGLIVLSALGFILFENTLGFFLIARGKHSTKEALGKVARLPALSALALALLLNAAGTRLPHWVGDLPTNVRGAYSVLGMLLVGLGLGRAAEGTAGYRVSPRLFGVAAFFRLLVWPAITMLVLWIDGKLGVYDGATRKILPLVAVVPLPAISVAYAATFDVRPREIALLVLGSTMLSLFLIPLELGVFAALFPR